MQISFIIWLQQFASPFWDRFFIGASMMAEETAFIMILACIYWCYDKRLGYKLGFLYLLNAPVNFMLKGMFDMPRPVGVEGIRSIYSKTAIGSAFPSGHSQLGGAFMAFLVRNIKNWGIKMICSALFFLIPLSRLYLGQHYPFDVIAGLAAGLMMLYISGKLFDLLYEQKKHPWILLFIVPILVLVFFMHDEDTIKLAGVSIAFLIGMIIEPNYIKFSTKANRNVQIVKYILGISILAALRTLLKIIFPQALLFDFIRYFIIGIFVTVIYPYFIKRYTNKREEK